MPECISSDQALMSSLKRGDTQALKILIERWESRLLQFIYRYIQNESTSRDLVQETFVKIYQNRMRFDEKRSYSTWMFGIAVNLCRNHQRWLKRHAEAPLETAPEPVEGRTPGDQIDDMEDVEELTRAVADLAHAYRVTLLLYYYEEQSYGEIAEVLGCTVRGVESRLYRARRLLAKRLGLNSVLNLKVSPGWT